MDNQVPVTVPTPVIPQRRTHQEIIDVDELVDEQDQRPPGRRIRDPTMSDIIIIDSDDASEAGPSTGPRHPGKATPSFSVMSLFSFDLIFEVLGYALLLRQYKLYILHLQYHLYHHVLVRGVHNVFYPKM
jgi:hypothetical protein